MDSLSASPLLLQSDRDLRGSPPQETALPRSLLSPPSSCAFAQPGGHAWKIWSWYNRSQGGSPQRRTNHHVLSCSSRLWAAGASQASTPLYLARKFWNGRRTEYPSFLMWIASSIPECHSWQVTYSTSKTSDSCEYKVDEKCRTRNKRRKRKGDRRQRV